MGSNTKGKEKNHKPSKPNKTKNAERRKHRSRQDLTGKNEALAIQLRREREEISWPPAKPMGMRESNQSVKKKNIGKK